VSEVAQKAEWRHASEQTVHKGRGAEFVLLTITGRFLLCDRIAPLEG
jgi:hypothetical protein